MFLWHVQASVWRGPVERKRRLVIVMQFAEQSNAAASLAAGKGNIPCAVVLHKKARSGLMISWAHGIVISYPLRMRKALGLNPSVSTCLVSGGRCISVHWDLFQVVAGASCCSVSSEKQTALPVSRILLEQWRQETVLAVFLLCRHAPRRPVFE